MHIKLYSAARVPGADMVPYATFPMLPMRSLISLKPLFLPDCLF